MNTKTVYAFDTNDEYAGETIAYESPEEKGKYPLPFGTTDKKPPAPKTGTVAKWSGDKWETVSDHRGKTVYEKATATPVIVDYIGELKDEHTDTEPPDQWHEWMNGKWTFKTLTGDELTEFIKTKESEIDKKVKERIFEGFVFDNETFSLSIEAQANWATVNLVEGDLPISTKDGSTYTLTQDKKIEFLEEYRGVITQAQAWGREQKEKLREKYKQK